MPTFKDVIDETHLALTGYTNRQDQATYLTAPISSTDLTITVADGTVLARGIIEIDDELIWVDRFDKANNLMTVAPGFGRGYQGTTASPHAQYVS